MRRRRQWIAVDVVVAVGILVVLLAYASLGHRRYPHEQHLIALLVVAPFASLPLAVRRLWPVPVFQVVLPASVAFGILASTITTVTGATYALYTVAVQESLKSSAIALLATEVGVAANFGVTAKNSSNPVNGAFTALVQLTVWGVGDALRRHRAYAASTREQSVRQALADQRLQIARELHDVVGHAMSVVAIQAGVGSHLIATRPEEAANSLAAIETTARAALSQTRYLLSAMRESDPEEVGMSPMPGLGDIDALVRQMADAGLRVTLRVEGQPQAFPPSLELSAYRVVQEALINVVKHAGPAATAEVMLWYDSNGDVTVEITDDGRPGRSSGADEGHGLTGMQERVTILGGELRAGPRAEGGFKVSAWLPAHAGGR